MAENIVTGAQGFLGSHLVHELLKNGEEVCSTYNYTPPNWSRWPAKWNTDFRCDVNNFEDCAKLIMQENPFVVYHLVAQPIVTAAKANPRLTFELTTRGTWNILEACRLYGRQIRAIVFMSSDKVYGNNVEATENSPLLGTDHPYNAAKVAADVAAQSYAKAYNMPVVIARSANLYGPMDFHWDRIVPGICRDIVRGEPTVIRSDGKQQRDYIYVTDLAKGLVTMGEYKDRGYIPNGAIYNFGSERMHTPLEILHKLLEIGGRVDLEPMILNQAKDEIPAQHIFYDKAKDDLKWTPTTSIEAGLDITFQWYKNFLK